MLHLSNQIKLFRKTKTRYKWIFLQHLQRIISSRILSFVSKDLITTEHMKMRLTIMVTVDCDLSPKEMVKKMLIGVSKSPGQCPQMSGFVHMQHVYCHRGEKKPEHIHI